MGWNWGEMGIVKLLPVRTLFAALETGDVIALTFRRELDHETSSAISLPLRGGGLIGVPAMENFGAMGMVNRRGSGVEFRGEGADDRNPFAKFCELTASDTVDFFAETASFCPKRRSIENLGATGMVKGR